MTWKLNSRQILTLKNLHFGSKYPSHRVICSSNHMAVRVIWDTSLGFFLSILNSTGASVFLHVRYMKHLIHIEGCFSQNLTNSYLFRGCCICLDCSRLSLVRSNFSELLSTYKVNVSWKCTHHRCQNNTLR